MNACPCGFIYENNKSKMNHKTNCPMLRVSGRTGCAGCATKNNPFTVHRSVIWFMSLTYHMYIISIHFEVGLEVNGLPDKGLCARKKNAAAACLGVMMER